MLSRYLSMILVASSCMLTSCVMQNGYDSYLKNDTVATLNEGPLSGVFWIRLDRLEVQVALNQMSSAENYNCAAASIPPKLIRSLRLNNKYKKFNISANVVRFDDYYHDEPDMAMFTPIRYYCKSEFIIFVKSISQS